MFAIILKAENITATISSPYLLQTPMEKSINASNNPFKASIIVPIMIFTSFHVLFTTFLNSSLFLYSTTNTAVRPAIAPIIIPTGPMKAVKAAPKASLAPPATPRAAPIYPKVEKRVPPTDTNFPTTVNTGPMVAATRASFKIIFCCAEERALNFSMIPVIPCISF